MPRKKASTIDQSVNRSIKEIILYCQGFCLYTARNSVSLYCEELYLSLLPGIMSLYNTKVLSLHTARDSISIYCQGFCLSMLPGILNVCAVRDSVSLYIVPGIRFLYTARNSVCTARDPVSLYCQEFCLSMLPGILSLYTSRDISLCCQGSVSLYIVPGIRFLYTARNSARDSVSLYCQEFCLSVPPGSLSLYTARDYISLYCQGFCLSV